MALAIHIQPTPATPGPGDIVSRCGLLCNTCSAYLTGACPGCPNLGEGECVIKDCADLKGTNCLDCQATSCYHFDAYPWRRKAMNAVVKHYVRLTSQQDKGQRTASSCTTSPSASSGCSGCSYLEAGCPAAGTAGALAAL